MAEKDPVPIRCPVAGAFNFTQEGDFPFQTRVLGGITKDPRHDVWGRTGQFSCKQNISRLAVCDTDQKEITIDETYCWSTDHLGRPIDIYSDPDYRMQCIGYWKENLKSYLITFDQLDAFTKYRCWVSEREGPHNFRKSYPINSTYILNETLYLLTDSMHHDLCQPIKVKGDIFNEFNMQVYQRADLNKVLMSMSVGPYCDLAQDVDSKSWRNGAVVSLVMDENERECKHKAFQEPQKNPIR